MSKILFSYEFGNISPEFWEENTSGICCWLDSEPFVGRIYSYPIRRENDKWIVKGVFCSLSCAKRYIVQNCFMNSGIFALFSLMCIEVYGISNVQIAPDIHLLHKFSIPGQKSMSLTEFRSNKSCAEEIKEPVYPFMFEKILLSENNLEYTASACYDDKIVQKKNNTNITLQTFFSTQPIHGNNYHSKSL